MADNIMTPEEEALLESLAKQRRGGRTLAVYGGPPPDLAAPVTCLPGYRTSGSSEPGGTMNGMARQIIKHSTRLKVGFADTVGRRPTMEDEIVLFGQIRNTDEDFYAVYDGHSGNDSSAYASKHLHKILVEKLNQHNDDITRCLKEAFIETNENMKRDNIGGGSTAIAALFINNKLYVANAGDSRAVIGDGHTAVRCSTDHKPDHPSEEERISKSGGIVVKTFNKLGKTVARVNGQLAVSRALGDHSFKPHVTSEPEVKEFAITPQHRVLIIACDGLWDVLEDQEALDIASSEEDPSQAAMKLRDTAYNRGSGDNISVVVINIPSTYGGLSKQVTTPSNQPTTTTPWWKSLWAIAPVVAVLGLLWKYLLQRGETP